MRTDPNPSFLVAWRSLTVHDRSLLLFELTKKLKVQIDDDEVFMKTKMLHNLLVS